MFAYVGNIVLFYWLVLNTEKLTRGKTYLGFVIFKCLLLINNHSYVLDECNYNNFNGKECNRSHTVLYDISISAIYILSGSILHQNTHSVKHKRLANPDLVFLFFFKSMNCVKFPFFLEYLCALSNITVSHFNLHLLPEKKNI